jgi:hypothetical protein
MVIIIAVTTIGFHGWFLMLWYLIDADVGGGSAV